MVINKGLWWKGVFYEDGWPQISLSYLLQIKEFSCNQLVLAIYVEVRWCREFTCTKLGYKVWVCLLQVRKILFQHCVHPKTDLVGIFGPKRVLALLWRGLNITNPFAAALPLHNHKAATEKKGNATKYNNINAVRIPTQSNLVYFITTDPVYSFSLYSNNLQYSTEREMCKAEMEPTFMHQKYLDFIHCSSYHLLATFHGASGSPSTEIKSVSWFRWSKIKGT